MYDDLRGFDCSEEVDEDMANAMIDCPVAILKWHDDFAKCDTLAKYFHNMQALESTARFLCYNGDTNQCYLNLNYLIISNLLTG